VAGSAHNRRPAERLLRLTDTDAHSDIPADGRLVFAQLLEGVLPPLGVEVVGYFSSSAVLARYSGLNLYTDDPSGFSILACKPQQASYVRVFAGAGALANPTNPAYVARSLDLGSTTTGQREVVMIAGDLAAPGSPTVAIAAGGVELVAGALGGLPLWIPPGFTFEIVNGAAANQSLDCVLRFAFGP
jgi:hypothetical protein